MALPSEVVDSIIGAAGAVIGWLLKWLRDRLSRKGT